ncbi:MAG: hypothetical protein NWE85_04545, partial [Candidatus Bathyarchaeota archaeon]|nr:hypothetical protein [Candidatus Bathyarchaeota archaeon]
RYRELTQNLVSDTCSHINYSSWLLPQPETKDTVKKLEEIVNRFEFAMASYLSLRSNPLLNRWDTKIMRLIIKKRYRMVYK